MHRPGVHLTECAGMKRVDSTEFVVGALTTGQGFKTGWHHILVSPPTQGPRPHSMWKTAVWDLVFRFCEVALKVPSSGTMHKQPSCCSPHLPSSHPSLHQQQIKITECAHLNAHDTMPPLHMPHIAATLCVYSLLTLAPKFILPIHPSSPHHTMPSSPLTCV
jgi:hypothetical protein